MGFASLIAGRNRKLVGEVVLPYYNETIDHELNERNILQALNSGNRFDFEPDLKIRTFCIWHLNLMGMIGNIVITVLNLRMANGAKQNMMRSYGWYHEETDAGKIKDALL